MPLSFFAFSFSLVMSGTTNDVLVCLQRRLETEFSALLSVAERTSGLYFSYDTNLTLRWHTTH